jgi:hypothetical protein
MGQGLAERHLLLGALPPPGPCGNAAVGKITGAGELFVTAEIIRQKQSNPILIVISVAFPFHRRSHRLTRPDGMAIYGLEMNLAAGPSLPAFRYARAASGVAGQRRRMASTG